MLQAVTPQGAGTGQISVLAWLHASGDNHLPKALVEAGTGGTHVHQKSDRLSQVSLRGGCFSFLGRRLYLGHAVS